MVSPFGELLLVANPDAGRRPGAAVPDLRDALDAAGLRHRVAVTDGPGHATQIARDAVEVDGVRLVVAVGGDGTVHEVVNGLVDATTGQRRGEAVLGLAPAGSGSDFARTFGLDRGPEAVARHLGGDTTYAIDLGRARCTGLDGSEVVELFANVAQAGYGGEVVARALRLPRLLGQVRYGLAMMAALRSFDLVDGEVEVDHTQVVEPMSNVVVANGQFFGGGMHVAPRAIPDDGRFNVQVFRGSVREVVRIAPQLRTGDHTSHPQVREYQSSRVTVVTEPAVTVEADGEVLGTTPATFDLLDKVLPLKI